MDTRVWFTLEESKVAYTERTEFLIQVGKGKGSYKTRYKIIGNLSQAKMYYNTINVGNGYKKRLLMPACYTRPVMARQLT